jgi:peroxiredoxin
MSSSVEINQPAPDFSLETFDGEEVKLSSFQKKKNVLLVFNRGFT